MPRVQEHDGCGMSVGRGVVRMSGGLEWQCTISSDTLIPTRASMMLAHMEHHVSSCPMDREQDPSAITAVPCEDLAEVMVANCRFVSVTSPCFAFSPHCCELLQDCKTAFGFDHDMTFLSAAVLNVQTAGTADSSIAVMTWADLLHRLEETGQVPHSLGVAHVVVLIESCHPDVCDYTAGGAYFRQIAQVALLEIVPLVGLCHVCVLTFTGAEGSPRVAGAEPSTEALLTPTTFASPQEFENLHFQKKRTRDAKTHRPAELSVEMDSSESVSRRIDFNEPEGSIEVDAVSLVASRRKQPSATQVKQKQSPAGSKRPKPLAPVHAPARPKNRHTRRTKEAEDELLLQAYEDPEEDELLPVETEETQLNFSAISSPRDSEVEAPPPFLEEWPTALFLKHLQADISHLSLPEQLAAVIGAIQSTKMGQLALGGSTTEPAISYKLMCLLEMRCRIHLLIVEDALPASISDPEKCCEMSVHLRLCMQTSQLAVDTIRPQLATCYGRHTTGSVEVVLLQLLRHNQLAAFFLNDEHRLPLDTLTKGHFSSWSSAPCNFEGIRAVRGIEDMSISSACAISRALLVSNTLLELVTLSPENDFDIAMCLLSLHALYTSLGFIPTKFTQMLALYQQKIYPLLSTDGIWMEIASLLSSRQPQKVSSDMSEDFFRIVTVAEKFVTGRDVSIFGKSQLLSEQAASTGKLVQRIRQLRK